MSRAGRPNQEKSRALAKYGIHPAHERQQVKQRNLEVLEERKRAMESTFATAEIKPVCLCAQFLPNERISD